MPRYQYECKVCGASELIFHLIDETVEDCSKCDSAGSMVKLLTKTNIKTKSKHKQAGKIGDITKKFIEENREILKQQKKDSKGNTHDPA